MSTIHTLKQPNLKHALELKFVNFKKCKNIIRQPAHLPDHNNDLLPKLLEVWPLIFPRSMLIFVHIKLSVFCDINSNKSVLLCNLAHTE